MCQAIKELNIKPKNWKELLTDEPFTRDDLITIQVHDISDLLSHFHFTMTF
jgi:peptidyl-prolyl cis-trans isomerase-like protein 2